MDELSEHDKMHAIVGMLSSAKSRRMQTVDARNSNTLLTLSVWSSGGMMNLHALPFAE